MSGIYFSFLFRASNVLKAQWVSWVGPMPAVQETDTACDKFRSRIFIISVMFQAGTKRWNGLKCMIQNSDDKAQSEFGPQRM